jgi:outer membrane protein assembly factor BamB
MKKIILIAIVLSAAIIGCQPEILFDTPELNPPPSSVKNFTVQNRAASQAFVVNNAAGQTITTAKGTKYYLPVNAFVHADGSAVTGDVSINVKEVLTPQEMIFNDMPTVSSGRLLESGGEYKITAIQNSKELKLAPGKLLRIQMPDAGVSMSGMKVFNGVADANGNVDWVANANPGNVVVGDSTLFSKGDLFCDSVNWINCDKFINDPTVEFTVFPGNAPGHDSTNIFIHLTGRNTVVKMNWTQGLSYFKTNMALAVPSTIVGVSVKNGQFYAAVLPVNIQNGQSTTLSFVPYTIEDLKARLKQLR